MVQENATGVRVVRAFGREKFEMERFYEKNNAFADLWIKLGTLSGLYWGIGDLITGLQVVAVIVLGAAEAVHCLLYTSSTGLIAAIPLEYITDFLSLEDDGQLMYYHIIRPDGSFVIQNPNTELWYFFEQLQKQLDAAPNELSVENTIKEFGAALKNHEEYATTFEVNGEERQIYGISLPYSEWYLVSVMPYSCLLYTSRCV